MDHALGRESRGNVPQSVSNCWALRDDHHRAKTDYIPSRAHWFLRFRVHCLKFGYLDEAAEAQKAIDWSNAKSILRGRSIVTGLADSFDD